MQFLSAIVALLPLVAAVAVPHQVTSLSVRTEDPCRIVKNITVVSGDTLNAIALAQNTTLAAIAYVNPNITNVDYIYVGEIVLIPSWECNDVAPALAVTPSFTATCAAVGTATSYTVLATDTLTIIAAHYQISLAALEEANPQITNPDVISTGQIINIPVCTS